MSKICPNCQAEYSDRDNFCPKCGVGLIGKTDQKNPAIILGDANAISGGININQSKNVVTHDVHYHTTTIQERIKSEAELKLEATNRIRVKAEEILAEKGRIDMVAIGELRHLAIQQGIDDNIFRDIIKDVRSNRVNATQELSATNSRYLHQAEQAIKSNDMECLMNLLSRLESMASISQDDNVQYLYHLTLSLFNPQKTIEAYELQTDENYWRTFWAIISYIRVNKYAEASRMLAKFDPIRYDKSDDDQILLEAYFNLMKNDKEETQSILNEIKGTLSEQLIPFLQDIKSKLSNDEADLLSEESFELGFYFQWILIKYDDAFYRLGVSYEWGYGVEGNNKEAFKWFRKAAEAGNAEAMSSLGYLYLQGYGVDKNQEESLKWYRKSAEAGNAMAMASLGDYYKYGPGIDEEEAFKWYEQAAKAGNTDAMVSLGDCYCFGEGCYKSERSAIRWYKKAAEAGNIESMNKLGDCYFSDKRFRNKEEAFKWYCKAADIPKGLKCSFSDFNDFEEAQNYYYKWGMHFLNGEGVNKEENTAQKLLYLSVKIGSLALVPKEAEEYFEKWVKLFKDEDEVCEDEDIACVFRSLTTEMMGESMKAEAWKEESIENDAKTLYEAVETGSDLNKIKDLQKLAEEGDGKAMLYLGLCYSNGSGVNQDDNEAYKWFCMGAELGESASIANIGWCYESGRGVEANPVEAMKWYQKALDNGYPMDEWMSTRLTECKTKIPSLPTAKIVSIWALNANPHDMLGNGYGNDSSIIVHCHIQVDNMNGRTGKAVLTMSTNGISFNKTESLTPNYDSCIWKDFRFPIYVNDIINLIAKGRHQFLAQVDLYDDQNHCMASSTINMSIKYSSGIFSGTKVEIV